MIQPRPELTHYQTMAAVFIVVAVSPQLCSPRDPLIVCVCVCVCRTYFAFISRAAGAFMCHVFLESKVRPTLERECVSSRLCVCV